MKYKTDVQPKDDASPQTIGNAPQDVENEMPSFASFQAKPKLQWKENGRLLFIGAGIVVVLLLLALDGITRRSASKPAISTAAKQQHATKTEDSAASESLTPILDTHRAQSQDIGVSRVDPEEVGRTASRQPKPSPATLADIKPFDGSQWQPAPYQPGRNSDPGVRDAATSSAPPQASREHDMLDKASLIFVKSSASGAATKQPQDTAGVIDAGIGLAPGTRLRARLESAVNTAVPTPIVAIIEYNYEKNGDLVVPAGARVFGHLDSADRSGYISVHFESLLLPDGASVPIEAAATDLQLRPLRGRVEGKKAGRNLLVRSFAGVGEMAATLVGRGSLNQPLGEGDLLRERVANNIGQASDQTVANLSLTGRFLVSLPADTEIYVILHKSSDRKVVDSPARATPQAATEELRQLMQVQRELNRASESTQQQ